MSCHVQVLLPEAQWPMSNALAAGSPWLVLLRGHTLLLLHLGTAGASPRVWSRATVSAELGEVVAANWVEGVSVADGWMSPRAQYSLAKRHSTHWGEEKGEVT